MNNGNSSLNPEERERIIADVLRKAGPLAPESELDVLIKRVQAADLTVKHLLTPIYDVELMSNNIHTSKGRQQFIGTALKLYLDSLRELSKDEALWMLALTRAEIVVSQFV